MLQKQGYLETVQCELEDALRLEATNDDIQNSNEGIKLVKWLRKRRRIMKRVFRLMRRVENG